MHNGKYHHLFNDIDIWKFGRVLVSNVWTYGTGRTFIHEPSTYVEKAEDDTCLHSLDAKNSFTCTSEPCYLCVCVYSTLCICYQHEASCVDYRSLKIRRSCHSLVWLIAEQHTCCRCGNCVYNFA